MNQIAKIMQEDTDQLKIQLYKSLLDKQIGTLEYGEANLMYHLSKEPCVQVIFDTSNRRGHKQVAYAQQN